MVRGGWLPFFINVTIATLHAALPICWDVDVASIHLKVENLEIKSRVGFIFAGVHIPCGLWPDPKNNFIIPSLSPLLYLS